MVAAVVHANTMTSSIVCGRYFSKEIVSEVKMVSLLAALSLWLLAGPALAAPSPGPAAAPSPSWGWWWQRWQTADCPGPGAFPDASDACSPAFRICAYMGPVRGLQPIAKSCQPGFVFNAVTGCTFKRECFQKLYPNAAGPWA